MAAPSRKLPIPHQKGASPTTKKHLKKHIDRFLQEVAHDAAQHIYDTMTDPQMPPDLRLRAAFDIMDRTMGKPVNQVDRRVVDEADSRREMPDLHAVPTAELEAVLKRLSDLSSGTSYTDVTPDQSDISSGSAQSDIPSGSDFDFD